MKCEIEKYENVDNIFSTSFFVLQKSYKSIDKYTDGLLMLANFVKDKFPDFKLRVYYDNSLQLSKIDKVNDTIKTLEKMKHVQLIKYECPDFITNFGHQDLFGTFIRFLPLFNTEKNNMIIISDIDIDENYKKDIMFVYDYFKNEKDYKFAYFTHNCYIKPWTKNIDFPIMAGSFLSKVKFPMEILANFMNCFLKNKKNYKNNKKDKNEKTCDQIKKVSNDIKNSKWYKANKDMSIIFGMDENFLNNYLLKYINENKIKYIVFLRKSVAPLKKIKMINKNELYNFVSLVLGNKYQKDKTLFINTQMLFDIIYDRKNGHEIIFNNLLSVLTDYKKQKKLDKINLTEDDYNCLVSQNFDEKYNIIKMN